MPFPFIVVTLDIGIAILGVQQQKGHVGVRNQSFYDFGVILGPYFESFLGSDGLSSMLFYGLFPGLFLH